MPFSRLGGLAYYWCPRTRIEDVGYFPDMSHDIILGISNNIVGGDHKPLLVYAVKDVT